MIRLFIQEKKNWEVF